MVVVGTKKRQLTLIQSCIDILSKTCLSQEYGNGISDLLGLRASLCETLASDKRDIMRTVYEHIIDETVGCRNIREMGWVLDDSLCIFIQPLNS